MDVLQPDEALPSYAWTGDDGAFLVSILTPPLPSAAAHSPKRSRNLYPHTDP